MYAHQVVEDIGRQISVIEKKQKRTHDQHQYLIHLKANTQLIKQSQKFHIPDAPSMFLMRKSAINKEYLFMEYAESIKIPYPITYIDYYIDDGAPVKIRASKVAAIVMQPKEDELFIKFCAFMVQWGAWVIGPASFRCRVGKLFSENDGEGGGNIMPLSVVTLSAGEKTKVIEESIKDLSIINNFILALNCKNVASEKIPAPERLNKQRRKAGKQELFDYHVLNVVVPSKKRGYHESTEPQFHNRVHLCRGHFKEYTAEHPLFGHYAGLYWWQPHVRGQNKNGIVMKDYAVIPAGQQP